MATPSPDPVPATVLTGLKGAALRAVRMDLGLSQSELAAKMRAAGDELGEPNQCCKRLIQKWERGEHFDCRPHYQRALSHVTGLPYAVFCSVRPVAYATVARRLDRLIRELTQLRAEIVNMDRDTDQ